MYIKHVEPCASSRKDLSSQLKPARQVY